MATRAGASGSFAFSLDIREEAEREATTADFPLPRAVSSREIFYPLFALLSVALFQVSLSLGYLGHQEASAVIVGHAVAVVLGVVVVWNTLWSSFREAALGIARGELRSSALISLATCALAIAAAIEITNTAEWYSASEQFTVTVSLLALWFAGARALTRKFICDCTFVPDTFPEFVTKLSLLNGEVSETAVRVNEVSLGEIVRFRAGMVAPCDGTVVGGIAEVLERRLTGEVLVCVKGVGDPLYAGSEIRTGSVDVKVQAIASDVFISSFAGCVRNALAELVERKSTLNRIKTRVYIGALFVATVASVFWIGNGAGGTFALSVFASVLLLSAAVPAANLVPLFARRFLLIAFSRGVIFKRFTESFLCLGTIDSGVIHESDDLVPVDVEIREFALIDERIDRQALLSVLFSVFGRSRNSVHLDIAAKLRAHLAAPVLYEVTHFELREDVLSPCPAIDASIEGIPFVIGTEDVLLAAGVQLQPSEMSEGAVYVAMQGEVVALFMFAAPEKNRFRLLFEKLADLKVRTVVCTKENESSVARLMGLGGGDVCTGMSDAAVTEKLQSLAPAFVLAGKHSSPRVQAAAPVSFSFFDDLTWSISNSDITLFTTRLSAIADTIRDAQAFRGSLKIFLYFAGTLSGLLAALASCGLGSPEISVVSIVLSGLFAYVLFSSRSLVLPPG